VSRGLARLVAAALLAGCGAPPAAPRAQPGAGVRIIVTLDDWGASPLERQAPRPQELASRLRQRATRTQAPLRAWLLAHGALDLVALPIINGLAVTVPAWLVAEVRKQPGVTSVTLDHVVTVPGTDAGAQTAPGWNLDAIRAPALWRLGLTGEGVVVANLDTGVDLTHPDLLGGYRGGANSWFDPIEHTTSPFDSIGHGTQTMALLAGGATSGAPLGVAPGAQWIAARIFDAEGRSSVSVIHQAFLWVLDPDGDPATADAPAVVSASWGLGAANDCDRTFERDLQALEQAGIAVIFAAGNAGPVDSTSMSPANNEGAFSAGSTDAAASVAAQSSRGPSACTGGPFPDLVAPGIDIRTADLAFGGLAQYTTVSGSSFAAPHVAGAVALLKGAHPDVSPPAIAAALRASAVPLDDSGSGHGLIDVYAAHLLLSSSPDRKSPPPGSPP
jgi:subtilisin family serine protease